MRFKVRIDDVRGLSDEAFRAPFGTEEQCRTALVRLRWPDGFKSAPAAAIEEHCVLAGRGLYQAATGAKKQTSHDGGHDLPRDQAAADTLVRRHPPDRDGEDAASRRWNSALPSRGQAAATAWTMKAQDHGGDGAAGGRHAAVGADGDGRCLPRRRALRAASGAAARRGKTPFARRRSRPVPRGARAS